MKTLARIMLPYLGAFTLAAILACPHADARPMSRDDKDRACYAMGGAVGAMVDARNRGMTQAEMTDRLSGAKLPARMAIIVGQVVAAIYSVPHPVDRGEAVGAFLQGCLSDRSASAM